MMLTEKIRILLLVLLQHDFVVASWGITDIEITSLKLSFSVYGFKYKGKVKIRAREADDLYDVYLENRFVKSCNIESIVSLLDSLIECDNNYLYALENYFLTINRHLNP